MNLDKKLAKYAKQLENPKYYGKILQILEKADKKEYNFKQFNSYDLEYITATICDYYTVITTKAEDRRMIKYCNKKYFLVSQQKKILFETYSFIKVILFIVKIKTMKLLLKLIENENSNNNIKIVMYRGAVKTAAILGIDINELGDKSIFAQLF